jgi:hypothetical protein
MNGSQLIENELQKRRDQAESVRGVDTPVRVEFRYRGGTKHWQYFRSADDAVGAVDSLCSYSPTGRAIIERPSSQVFQFRGPRGGWSKREPSVSYKL